MNKPSVLVVDDTIANLELVELILHEKGYEVRTSLSGEMALKTIEAEIPNLILLDIMMPGIDGYETCERIKQNPLYADIPIIFLSAKSETVDKVKGFELGAVDYITKPFEIDEVLARVNTHILLSSMQRDLEHKLKIIDKYVISSSTDLNGSIIEASEAFCKISGYTKNELIGKNHNILRHKDMPDELYADLWKTIKSGKSWQSELKNKKKDGNYYWVDIIISPNKDINGRIIGYNSVRYDITDKKKIQELSITDQLTGLYNRRYFNDVFDKDIKHSIRQSSLLAFLMIDIDFFKQYNDTYGHQAGDEVLNSIGKVLKEQLKRTDDYAFRLGGEEFGVVYVTKTCENAKLIAEELRITIENLKIEHSGSNVSNFVTASFGLACVDFSKKKNYEINHNSLYKIADDELYKAKDDGRNRVSIKIL